MYRKMRIITVKMPDEMIERITMLARENGMTRSELIRRAIKLYLKVMENGVDEDN